MLKSNPDGFFSVIVTGLSLIKPLLTGDVGFSINVTTDTDEGVDGLDLERADFILTHYKR